MCVLEIELGTVQVAGIKTFCCHLSYQMMAGLK